MLNKLILIASFFTAIFIFTTKATPAKTSEKPSISIEELEKPVISIEEKINSLYKDFSEDISNMPSLTSFEKGMLGYYQLVKEGKIENEILTIVDFSLSSAEKRMWIFDMASEELLFHTYVAHGRNTGVEMATEFSNTKGSYKSSLGFYVTAETYYGKNGLSLFIDGMEKGFNSNARKRYVVIHGSKYATADFVERMGRLGRSLGCPAVPAKISDEIIETIKGNSCLFIYYPDENYLQSSEYLELV